MIEIRNLFKNHGTQTVLVDFNLVLKPGEIVVLLGENGAGKSTALDVVFGLTKADSGKVLLDSKPAALDETLWKTQTALVAERIGLFPHLTLTEQMNFVGLLYGISSDETKKRREELLRFFDLSSAAEKTAAQCSLGMQNKLSLALGLLAGPRYLFIDEALNGLDPVSVVKARILLQKLAERGVGILVCSHVLDHLENFGDRVLILKGGKVHTEKTREELEASGKSVETLYLEAHPELQSGGEPWLWF